LSWAFALLVVSYSLLGLWRCGGATWVRYFAFPVCFPLIAVPWLARFENGVVHGLTRGVAFAAVEIAGWLRIGAYQRGNIIELANGFVGVDEACSGVRTLQAAIMVALFLGEILRLRAGRRVALVAAGCGWVFVCNIVRATALVIIGARKGLPALEQWHDLVGNAVLLFGMAGLAVIASVLREPQQPRRGAVTASAARAISLPEMGAALAWLALVFAATELWYRAHERELVPRPLWTAHWPQGSNATALPIAESTAVVLRYNQASSAAWTGPGGERWWGFFARWEPKRTALQLVRSHSPEICLPAVGRTFVGDRGRFEFNDGMNLSFRASQFVQEGRPLFVFVGVQEDKAAPAAQSAGEPDEWSARGRLRATWSGKRNLGQRLLELAVVGHDDFDGARAALAETVRQIVEPTPPTGLPRE
jgi:exosortase